MEEEKPQVVEAEKPQPEKKSKRYFGKLLVVFVLLAALIFFGAKVFLDNKTVEIKTSLKPEPTSSVSTPTSIVSPSAVPTHATATKTPTPTPTNVFKFGFKKGSYSPYKITLEPGWTATPGVANSDTRQAATISKGLYSISLTEDLSQMTGRCTYPGETPTGTDRPFNSYSEIQAGTNTFRRGLTTISSPSETVCQKQISGYEFPTQFGYMLYNFPTGNIDADIIVEMDKMISSIRPTQ